MLNTSADVLVSMGYRSALKQCLPKPQKPSAHVERHHRLASVHSQAMFGQQDHFNTYSNVRLHFKPVTGHQIRLKSKIEFEFTT
jgi:hypothetical protein